MTVGKRGTVTLCVRGKVGVLERDMRIVTLYVTARLITGDLSEIIAIDGGEGCGETERKREIKRETRYIILVTLYTS